MNIRAGLSPSETEAEFERAWQEEFVRGRNGSICRFTFNAHFYANEKGLKKLGQLDQFLKTQRLPDYQRAEDAVRRGWAIWLNQEFGIEAKDDRNKLKIRQFTLLYSLRGMKSREAQRQALRRSAVPCGASAAAGDDEFFRRLGRALEDVPGTAIRRRDFAHVLLANWLPAFWWLMPLKSVACDMARIEGKHNDAKVTAKLYQNLRQITTRRQRGSPGKFFSAGWNGVFYSSTPPLIDYIEHDGSPALNAVGRRSL